MKTYTITQINNYVKTLLDNDVFVSGFFIEGEVSNYKTHPSGHIYFTFKDESSSINAVMFKGDAAELEFEPRNGVKVTAYGRVSIYEKTASCQLYVQMMRPVGLGARHMAYEILKGRLAEEGLFDITRKSELPRFPVRIGIVTSRAGAALQDIINVAGRRNPSVGLLLAHATVQGQDAPREIAEAIELLNSSSNCDVIIVGRGGGSAEDLWAFNEEVVVRAVAASRIPIISAVGHETDYTLCDLAADLRAPTPSAAAEICVPELADILRIIHSSQKLLKSILDDKIEYYGDRLTSLTNYMRNILDRRINYADVRLAHSLRILSNLAPHNILKRGYAVLSRYDKNVISTKDIQISDIVNIQLTDGDITAEVMEISSKD
ncbi:MAG: exodeoxyribonuclease VII large subunit [Defluviitaleaceae bacterium]|nr:exodeoxyribonuclease VII large subunit [Defluviitaleaceae bacterium]